MSDHRGNLERLLQAVQERCDLTPRVGLRVLASLQSVLRAKNWRVTCIVRLGDPYHTTEIIEVLPGYSKIDIFGIAVDVGTTTIAATLCNLVTGEVARSAGMVNPQTQYGAALTSRVSHLMMDQTAQSQMTKAVRHGLGILVKQMSDAHGVEASQIVDAVVVCNPIMYHLHLGIDPTELGQAPFTCATSSAISVDACDVDLPIHPLAKVYLLPAIASHVGADAAAVVLNQAPQSSKALTLIVDIGTNAEIFLGNSDQMVATSCPMGPALEGATISHGQRAAPGAIETVQIDPVTKKLRFKVIGSDLWSDDPEFETSVVAHGVTGICGSGVIDIVAEMRMAGIIDRTGRMGGPNESGCTRCFADGRTFSLSLYEGERHIVFTNNDVREVQMAKAALYASIRLLMDDFGTDTVDRIVLAGAFGSHISVKHALVLGIILDCELDQITMVGNAASDGACRALLAMSARRQIETYAQKIINVETAVHPAFQGHFLAASEIPNVLDPLLSLAKVVTLPDVNFRGRRSRTNARRLSV